MAPRKRSAANEHLKKFPGLGVYPDGRYYFQNQYTNRQRSLKTKDLKTAVGRWALAKALSDKEYGHDSAAKLAESLKESNTPLSKGANIHLCDFIKKWRTEFLEKGLVKVKIKRDQGMPISARTQDDYAKQAKQLEALDSARFPLASPKALKDIRAMLAPWIAKPTHYNHLKAMLGRVYDHAVLEGLLDKSPMRDIEKIGVPERKVLIPDNAYVEITGKIAVHRIQTKTCDGTWRAMACDLFYMLSQQPIDGFSLRMSQLKLDFGDHGEIHLSRAKTGVEGVIEMNAEMREVIDWLIRFRTSQLHIAKDVIHKPETDHLLIYPSYMGRKLRWKPVKHRTFSKWWKEAVTEAGYKGQYWLMDLRKKGLTDEFVGQGENDKGLHETDAMKRHYRLITPPKRSKNTLTSIRSRTAEG